MAEFKSSLLDFESLLDSLDGGFKSKDTPLELQESLFASFRSFMFSVEALGNRDKLFLLFVWSIFRFCWGDSFKADELFRRFYLVEAKLWEEGNLSCESIACLCLGTELVRTSSFFSQAILLSALMPKNTRQAEKQISFLISFCLWLVILFTLMCWSVHHPLALHMYRKFKVKGGLRFSFRGSLILLQERFYMHEGLPCFR